MPVRCLLVDDSESFLLSATRLLESDGLRVVGTASTSADAIRVAEESEPDVVLVDVELGEESGFDLARTLSAAPHELPVVLISTYPLEDLADLVAASPAVGFVPKSGLGADAVNALLARRSRER